MVYAYKITNGTVNYLGASDEQDRLIKALEMANISTEGMLIQENELVQAGGKWYLSEDDEGYKVAKAQEEAEAQAQAEIEALRPTVDDLAEALDILTGIVLGEE